MTKQHVELRRYIYMKERRKPRGEKLMKRQRWGSEKWQCVKETR